MIGRVFCLLWSHSWRFMFTNDGGRAVALCSRCGRIKNDRGKGRLQ